MKKLKSQIIKYPEVYFILISILAAYKPGFTFNWTILVFGIAFLLQLTFQNLKFGVFLAAAALLVNLLMLAALISELSEFSVINTAALELLIGGSLFWLLNMFFTGLLFYKNVRIKTINTSVGKVF